MRSGPGQDHSIVVAIPAGSDGVTIGQCRSADDGRSRYSWCKARWNGESGWVSSSGLVASTTEAASEPRSSPRTSTLRNVFICKREDCSYIEDDLRVLRESSDRLVGWRCERREALCDKIARDNREQSLETRELLRECIRNCEEMYDSNGPKN
jgi:hypothetical protein